MTTRAQALTILNDLREQHRAENWLRPKAKSWDECHVEDTAGMSLAEFEKQLKTEGYDSFEEFFVQSLIDE